MYLHAWVFSVLWQNLNSVRYSWQGSLYHWSAGDTQLAERQHAACRQGSKLCCTGQLFTGTATSSKPLSLKLAITFCTLVNRQECGRTVVWWLTLSHRSEMILSSNPGCDLFCVEIVSFYQCFGSLRICWLSQQLWS